MSSKKIPVPSKCPKCLTERRPSIVSYLGESVTGVAFTPHFVDGTQHVHDPNRYTHEFGCTQGHRWSISFRKPCLECPYPKTVVGQGTGDSISVAEVHTDVPPELPPWTREHSGEFRAVEDAPISLSSTPPESTSEEPPDSAPVSVDPSNPLPLPPRVPEFGKKKGSSKKDP